MARFQLSPGDISGGDSMLDLLRIAQASEAPRIKQQTNQAKTTITSLINSYNTATSPALQQEIVNTMKSYSSILPPALRVSIEPYIKHGPTSEIAEKTRQFMLLNEPPKPPILNEAPGAETSNSYLQAQHLFEQADYKRKLNSFVYGVSAAGEKTNFIPLQEGTAAVRDGTGQVMLMSQTDLALKELSEETGISVRDMLLNPNGVPTGKKGFMIQNGRKISTEQIYKPFEPDPEKRYGQRQTDVSAVPKSTWDIDHSTSIRKMLMSWKDPGTKDTMIKDWKKRALKKPNEVSEEMSRIWPQYTFRVVDVVKEGWFKKIANLLPFVSSNEESAIIPIPGLPLGIPDSTGKLYNFYYNSTNDLVFNGYGEPLGSRESVVEMMSTKSVRGDK